ncbi:MAG: hypothetical protein GY852_00825 [bacterium]|nr:hypothetical protein [bacterium]
MPAVTLKGNKIEIERTLPEKGLGTPEFNLTATDLPFAHSRFCEVEALNDVVPLSSFRYPEFGKNYGVAIRTGPLSGLLARAVIVLSSLNQIVYTELAPEITHEPDYNSTLAALRKLV